jgi:hypothetical protein
MHSKNSNLGDLTTSLVDWQDIPTTNTPNWTPINT